MATTDREPTRYALNCLQLRGRGDIAATDGHHILIQSGFAFPWAENLLVPAKSVLGCQELDTGERYVSAWLATGSRLAVVRG